MTDHSESLSLLSPPVVRHAGPNGFTVSIEVNRLFTGAVEWDWQPDALTHTAVPDRHGLIDADDQCLAIPVIFDQPTETGQWVYYRVVARSLDYANAYSLTRGPVVATSVRALRLPHAGRDGATLALVTPDTGEDKPDAHPCFAGTAAYEPYRERQAVWLKRQLTDHRIATAPFKIVFSHIPIRGQPGENDGSTLEGYAGYSGQGARLWLAPLLRAGMHAIISGHIPTWRIDPPTTA